MEEIPISFESLEFGSRGAFERALTELRYLGKINERLEKDDFQQVAQKYQFPPEFLKAGLKGLSFPDDFMISKSRWFPVLYRWAIYKEDALRKLVLLITRYFRARFSAIIIPAGILITAVWLALFMNLFIEQNLFDVMTWLLVPVVLLIIEFTWEFYVRIGEQRKNLEEHIEYMKDEGMVDVVKRVKHFTETHYLIVLFAGHILASKPLNNLFQMGVIKKGAETILVFYAENPHFDYEKRLSKFFELTEPQK